MNSISKDAFTWRRLVAAVERWETVDLVRLLTLLALLLSGPGYWYARIPITVLALAGVLLADLRAKARFWLCITVLVAASNWLNLYEVDNHKHLMSYWCGALWLTAESENASDILEMTARWLVGCTFLFATAWKLMSPDFLNGDFFHHEFLFDSRFRGAVQALTGAGPELFQANEEALRTLDDPLAVPRAIALTTAPGLQWAGSAVAWWTVFIEGSIAICFLVPPRAVGKLRDALLMTFAATTYFLAPVIGFGYMLLTMGVAQQRDTRWRLAYLAAFVCLYAYKAPLRVFVSG